MELARWFVGLGHQDHGAAQFILEMINNQYLKQVECETRDDIVPIWLKADGEQTEYVSQFEENILTEVQKTIG